MWSEDIETFRSRDVVYVRRYLERFDSEYSLRSFEEQVEMLRQMGADLDDAMLEAIESHETYEITVTGTRPTDEHEKARYDHDELRRYRLAVRTVEQLAPKWGDK